MADTTFINGVTLTDADWFNDVNRLHYTIFGDPADDAAARTNLGLGTLATLSAASSTLVGGYIDWTVAGNALTLSVKTNAGNDPSATEPVSYEVRDATAATGELVTRSITAALSLTVPDTALLGTVNNAAFRLWAVIFNDAGTDRIGVINCATISANAGSGYNVTGIYPLAGWGIASSTAVGTGSDSSATFYTGSAVSSKGYTVVGYATWESGLATAGTWSAGPTREQLWGPSVPLPGQMIQVQRTMTGAVATGSTVMPIDDSIPQSGEGDQYMASPNLTPTSAANALLVDCQSNISIASANALGNAIFRDSTANAIAAVNHNSDIGTGLFLVALKVFVLAASTSATSFKYRAGTNGGVTATFNGSSGGRLYADTCNSFLEVSEVMA